MFFVICFYLFNLFYINIKIILYNLIIKISDNEFP